MISHVLYSNSQMGFGQKCKSSSWHVMSSPAHSLTMTNYNDMEVDLLSAPSFSLFFTAANSIFFCSQKILVHHKLHFLAHIIFWPWFLWRFAHPNSYFNLICQLMSGAINLRKQVVASIGNKKTYNLAHLLESDGLKTFPYGIPYTISKFSSANLNLFVFFWGGTFNLAFKFM